MTVDHLAEVLDELSESYVKLASELWEEGRIRVNRGEISLDDFKKN